MEQHGRISEHDERDTASVGRSQNAVHILPHDVTSAASVLGAVLERLDHNVVELQLLLVTPDPDAAIAVARAASSLAQTSGLRIIPASSARRATRLLRAGPVHGVIGAPTELLELVRTSVLKLEHVRALVLAWVNEIVDDTASREALEAVLGEVPKDAARTIIASRQTPDVEQLIERYARRARRVGDATSHTEPMPIRYVSTSAWGRLAALHRALNELDPEVAAVFTRSDAAERELRALLDSLGHAGDESAVRITRGGPVIEADTLFLLDVPTREELRSVMGGATPRVVAIIQPRQLDTLRALAGTAAIAPLHASDASARAQRRVSAIRSSCGTCLRAASRRMSCSRSSRCSRNTMGSRSPRRRFACSSASESGRVRLRARFSLPPRHLRRPAEAGRASSWARAHATEWVLEIWSARSPARAASRGRALGKSSCARITRSSRSRAPTQSASRAR